MITCLDDVYFEKLEKYVGKKLDIIKKENEIKFYADVEIQYILEKEEEVYSFYIVARGIRSKLAENKFRTGRGIRYGINYDNR